MRKVYPKAQISFLTSCRCQDIVSDYEGVNRIITFDRHGKHKGLLNRLRFTADLRKEKFDLIIVLKGSLNYIFMGVPNVWCAKRQASKKYRHPVDKHVDLLHFHGVNTEDVSFSFNLTKADDVFWEDFSKKEGVLPNDTLIGILPLAAWSLKSWPIERWNKLAEILKNQYGIKVLNLAKMPNSDLGRRVAKEISKEIIPADKTSLSQAKALLKHCQIFIGPDSSLLHLSSCMGVETVGLYGATSGEHFYPYFHRHNIVFPERKLSCVPCYPGKKPACCANGTKRDFGACMEEIPVESVLGIIQEKLNLR